MTKKENNRILIISQHYYGNRTGTEVSLDWIDHFLRGEMSREIYGSKDIEDVVRKVIRVPGTENIVIVYEQTQEDRYINEDFPELYAREGAKYLECCGKELKMNVSCEIPEIDFKIHTRCFACRMDEFGTLQSLKAGDCEQFIHYFPV